MTKDPTNRPHPARSRAWHWGGAVVLVGVGVGAATSGGCSTLADDCVAARCWQAEGAAGGSATGSGTPSGSGSGTPSGGSACLPDAPPHDGGCADDGDGIFVSNDGDDANAGTRSAPLATLGAAVALAPSQGKRRLYVCAGSYPEAVVVPAGLQLFGGLDCHADWAWTGGETTVAPTGSGEVPLTLQGGGADTTVVEDVTAVAPDGSDPGDSSVAVLATAVEVELRRCVLSAGQGADGDAGIDASSDNASSGSSGNPGNPSNCSANPVPGGLAKNDSHCTLSMTGGKGGDGGTAGNPGGNGSPGSPSPAGAGGPGQPLSGAWDCPYSSADGLDGNRGALGAPATGDGQLTVSGYHGQDGGAAGIGDPGRPGGGGGGARPPSGCSISTAAVGSSGGGGGTGGCGGAGGGGGHGGGSSIALVSVEAFVTLIDCELSASTGGGGGRGGNGQPGGLGGPGGTGGVLGNDFGCDGGSGGDGGRGGAGGGGRGGHSLAIAYKGSPPLVQGGSLSFDQAGPGGDGGDANIQGNQGDAGEAAEVLSFP